MKLLLLPAQEKFPPPRRAHWDLIVDLGRAPISTYKAWSEQAACPVISIFDFACEIKDLHYLRDLLHFGMGNIVDRWGIDWWSVISLEVVPELQQLMLLHRLAKHIGGECDIYSSRRDFTAVALHRLLGGQIRFTEGPLRAGIRTLRRYSRIPSQFDYQQILQIAQDKYDREHAVRGRFTRRGVSSGKSSVLLPSAYINVSRTALAYASLLPEQHFILACARDNAKVKNLPANVSMLSLDPYFSAADADEVSSLWEKWERSKLRLIRSAVEYETAATGGVLDRVPSLIRWGVVVRDAWNRLFDSEDIRACFCADQNNSYTRIPLLLAKCFGIPAIACHHGALDSWMAMRDHDADFYVAKTAMELDYMEAACNIPRGKIVSVAAPNSGAIKEPSRSASEPWLVFFSEPYAVGWARMEETYKDLLPPLVALADTCGLKLVFKLHPFENRKSHRRLLLRHLPEEKVKKIEILAGTISGKLWANTGFALTAQSSIALECAARNIPVFLCGWLRDSFSGYVQQYQKFGVGHLLESANEIPSIPMLLERQTALTASLQFESGAEEFRHDFSEAAKLRSLLTAVPVSLAAKIVS